MTETLENRSIDKNIVPSKLLLALNHTNIQHNISSSILTSSSTSSTGSSSFSPPPLNRLNETTKNDLSKLITPPFTPDSSSSTFSSVYQTSNSKRYQNNLIANVNSINVILDQSYMLDPTEYNNNTTTNWNIQSYDQDDENENDEQDYQEQVKIVKPIQIEMPIRDRMHSELVKKIGKHEKKKAESNSLSSASSKSSSLKGHQQQSHLSITNKSTKEECKNFLISKEFSNKIVLMFGELNGAQLFSLTRHDLEKFCGKDEGSRLESQLKVQKSLCGFKEETTNELESILQKRKEKSELK